MASRVLGVDEVASASSSSTDDALGQRLEQLGELPGAEQCSPVGSFGLQITTTRVRSLTASSSASAPNPGTGTARAARASRAISG